MLPTWPGPLRVIFDDLGLGAALPVNPNDRKHRPPSGASASRQTRHAKWSKAHGDKIRCERNFALPMSIRRPLDRRRYVPVLQTGRNRRRL
jgi:hypothetical protein